jgi:hypothetical protein
VDARNSVGILLWSFVIAAACGAADDPPQDTSTGATSDTTAGAVSVERCPEFPTQAECKAATVGPAQDTCAWLEVRVPGPTCASDVVVAQCVGLTYVGEGCQALECEGPGSSATVDGFFREVDGAIQVFANPPAQCGLVALHDGWGACLGDETPPECSCLCGP